MDPQSETNYRGTGCGKAARPGLKGSGEATSCFAWKKLPTMRITFIDNRARQASGFFEVKAATPVKSLFFVFLAVMLITFSACGGENGQDMQAVKTLREEYEQRKKDLIAEYLEQEFEVPEVDRLFRPDFRATLAGTLERPRVTNSVPFSRSFTQKTSARALLLLSENRDIPLANQLFIKVCRFYLECDVTHMVDKDSFYWATESYLHLYHGFGSRGRVRPGALEPETEQAFIDVILRWLDNSKLVPLWLVELSQEHDGYWYQRSENHWFMEVVTLWSFCEILAELPEYQNRMLPEGKTVAEVAAYMTDYLKTYIRGRASKGFLTEVAAGGYGARMLAMFSSIQDYARDERLREMAGDIQDLYWAFWAEEQIAGERGGGKVRERAWYGLIPHSKPVSSRAWLYLGLGKQRPDLTAMYINTLCSSYYPGDIVLRLVMERKREAPYAIVHRRVGKYADNPPEMPGVPKLNFYDTKGHLLKYSWCEKGFILGTIMRPPLDASAWPLGSTQSWHHGLLIEGNNMAEHVVPKVLIQDTFNEQYAVQSKGTLICRRLYNERNGDAPMGVFISSGLAEYMLREENEIFINSPNAHIAVRFVTGGYTQFDLSGIANMEQYGSYFKNDEMYSPVIVEVAPPGMFADFTAFKNTIQSQDPKIVDGRLDYKTVYGDELTLFTEPDGIPLINGKEIDYHPEIVYNSPYINSKYNSGIIDIKVGDETVQLNFND